MSHSPTRPRRRAALAVALGTGLFVVAPAAQAAPASVKLRVEGRSTTLYEKPVTSDGHDVTTALGGRRKCDGTNGKPPANPSPGPTSTATLDDGAREGGFTFDGPYNADFDDFFVSRIGSDSESSTEFWGHATNFEFSNVGGCQQRVGTGDEVLWVLGGFGKPLLNLTGPTSARTGQTFGVRVTDGTNAAPLSGASVGGKLTDSGGRATLSYSTPGVYRLKATRADSVRSPLLTVCVDPVGAPSCTSGDKSSPEVELLGAGGKGGYASDRFTSRTVEVSWQGNDGTGSGVSRYDVDVRETGAAAASSAASDWRSLRRGTTRVSTRFRGRSGRRYEFRVTAIDRAGNRRSTTGNDLLIPVDDRDRSLIRFSRGWKRLERTGAWGRFVVRSTRRGASARLRFRGRRLALIGRRLPRGGKLRVTIDDGSRTVRLRGVARHRRVLFTSKRLASGLHRVRLVAVGGGPVELDAVAVQPR